MMMYVAVLSLVTASLFGMTVSDDDTWKAFHARMKAFDTTLDYTQVRMAYVRSSAYNPYGELSTSDMIMDAYRAVAANNTQRARILLDSALAGQPLNVQSNIVMAALMERIGRSDSAKAYRRIADGVLNALASSGDGRSASTAMVAISTGEEYAYMNMFNLTPLFEIIRYVDGKRYNLRQCRTADGDTVRIWFNIDLSIERLSRTTREK